MRFPPDIENEILLKQKLEEFKFDSMVNYFRSLTLGFPDKRTGENLQYSIEDFGMGAFSVFFTQSPSFLSFQDAMKKAKGNSNAQTIFDMNKIPSDNHIRDLLDEVHPSYVFPMFDYIVDGLNTSGYLNNFRSFNNNLLLAFDGTQYFSSNKIHCENCSTKTKNGKTNYSHIAITPVFVKPGMKKVISLQPEFITPQDGHKKQDCENAAAKRWLNKYSAIYKELGITILGDDLYCKNPLCDLILEKGFDFILTCKPTSHKTLYEWVEELDNIGGVNKIVVKRWTGKRHEIDTYRFVNKVPLRDGDDALNVNWCELTTTLHDGTIIYKNAFATNYEITEKNVIEIVEAGRTRWKIENENNNTLKTKGYNLNHNFGHGQKHLSSLLLTFNLLAFLFHTVLEIFDEKYRLIRDNLPTRKTFFDDIRALTRYVCFDSWDHMLSFMIRGLKLKIPDTS